MRYKVLVDLDIETAASMCLALNERVFNLNREPDDVLIKKTLITMWTYFKGIYGDEVFLDFDLMTSLLILLNFRDPDEAFIRSFSSMEVSEVKASSNDLSVNIGIVSNALNNLPFRVRQIDLREVDSRAVLFAAQQFCTNSDISDRLMRVLMITGVFDNMIEKSIGAGEVRDVFITLANFSRLMSLNIDDFSIYGEISKCLFNLNDEMDDTNITTSSFLYVLDSLKIRNPICEDLKFCQLSQNFSSLHELFQLNSICFGLDAFTLINSLTNFSDKPMIANDVYSLVLVDKEKLVPTIPPFPSRPMCQDTLIDHFIAVNGFQMSLLYSCDIKSLICDIINSKVEYDQKKNTLLATFLVLSNQIEIGYELGTEQFLELTVRSLIPDPLVSVSLLSRYQSNLNLIPTWREELTPLLAESIAHCDCFDKLSDCTIRLGLSLPAPLIEIQSPYVDRANNRHRLIKHVSRKLDLVTQLITPSKTHELAPVLPILQASGTGKSRLVRSLAPEYSVVFLEAFKTNPVITEILDRMDNFSPEGFATALVAALCLTVGESETPESLWESQSVMLEGNKSVFWVRALSQFSSLEAQVQGMSNPVSFSVHEAMRALPLRDGRGRIAFFIVLDEIQELIKLGPDVNIYKFLRIGMGCVALSAFKENRRIPFLLALGTGSNLLTLQPEISQLFSDRIAEDLLPFYLINTMNINKCEVTPLKFSDISSESYALTIGRPGLLDSSQTSFEKRFAFWLKKLLGDRPLDIVTSESLTISQCLAVYGVTAGIRLNPTASQLNSEMCSHHLMLIVHVSRMREVSLSYAREPLLAFCGSHVMSVRPVALLRRLKDALAFGYLDRGNLGELVCRIIAIMARNHCMRDKRAFDFFTLKDWLNSLSLKCVPLLKSRGYHEKVETLLAAQMNFSHFADCDYTPDLATLQDAVFTFSAITPPPNQRGFDMVIGAVLNKDHQPPFTRTDVSDEKVKQIRGYWRRSDRLFEKDPHKSPRLVNSKDFKRNEFRMPLQELSSNNTVTSGDMSIARITMVTIQARNTSEYKKKSDAQTSPQNGGLLGVPNCFTWDRPSLGLHFVLMNSANTVSAMAYDVTCPSHFGIVFNGFDQDTFTFIKDDLDGPEITHLLKTILSYSPDVKLLHERNDDRVTVANILRTSKISNYV